MPKVIIFLLFFLITAVPFLVNPSPTQALPGCPQIKSVKDIPRVYTGQNIDVEVTFESDFANPRWNYHILIAKTGTTLAENDPRTSRSGNQNLPSEDDPTLTFSAKPVDEAAKFYIELRHNENNFTSAKVCDLGTIDVFSQEFANINNCTIKMPDNIKYESPYKIETSAPDVSGIKYSLVIYSRADGNRLPKNRVIAVNSTEFGNLGTGAILASANIGSSDVSTDFSNAGGTEKLPSRKLEIGDYTAAIVAAKTNDRFFCATKNFSVSNKDTTEATEGLTNAPPGDTSQSTLTSKQLCGSVGQPTCGKAAGQGCKNPDGTPKLNTEGKPYAGIETAIGCVPTEPKELISGILRFVTGAAGGIALLLMAFGAIKMITSAGNPEALKGGQEQFTAAIVGLLFIIFSVVLLRIIGVDILGLGDYFK